MQSYYYFFNIPISLEMGLVDFAELSFLLTLYPHCQEYDKAVQSDNICGMNEWFG